MNEAKRITIRLRQRYTEWTKDPPAPGKVQIPYLRWKDDGAREAYQLICKLWRFPLEA
jgi:hypothetical protein